jgi:hypothetical protein
VEGPPACPIAAAAPERPILWLFPPTDQGDGCLYRLSVAELAALLDRLHMSRRLPELVQRLMEESIYGCVDRESGAYVQCESPVDLALEWSGFVAHRRPFAGGAR